MNDSEDNFQKNCDLNGYPKHTKHQSEFFENRYSQNYPQYTREFSDYSEMSAYNMTPFRSSCPTHDDLQQNGQYDSNQLRTMWKRERNRLAAKKSRDKKAVIMKQLAIKERALEEDVSLLKEVVNDYDNVLKEILSYLENVIGSESKEGMILLFDCLCRLKRSDGVFITEPNEYFDKILGVTNHRLESLTTRIRTYLNDMLYKYGN